MNQVTTGCGSCRFYFNGCCTNPDRCAGVIAMPTIQSTSTSPLPYNGDKKKYCPYCGRYIGEYING